MEIAATQGEMELETKLKRLQLKDTEKTSGDSSSSANFSITAEDKTKQWF